MVTKRRVGFSLLLAAGAVVLQAALTTYPDTQGSARVFWAALSLVLLWFVYRGSNLARMIFVVLAAVGCVLFALASLSDPTALSVTLALLYAVQVATMIVAPVREWAGGARVGRVVPRTG